MILKSLFESDVDLENVEIFILNNHPKININEEYNKYKITVITNFLRPTISTAYIPRDWNSAIIHGFQDLLNPKCDAVITIQNDTVLKENWYSLLVKYSKTYNFMTFGEGDAFIYHTPESVKKIGLFDERFSGIGYYEGDYFLRAFIYNNEKSSVNDFQHCRDFNSVDEQLLVDTSKINTGNEDLLSGSKNDRFSKVNRSLWWSKWRIKPYTEEYKQAMKHKKTSNWPYFMFYPWFECNVETLDQQNFLFNEILNKETTKYAIQICNYGVY
jgi:hypothetical protein